MPSQPALQELEFWPCPYQPKPGSSIRRRIMSSRKADTTRSTLTTTELPTSLCRRRSPTRLPGFFASLSAVPATGNGVQGWTGYAPWASALKAGRRIGSQQYFPGKVLAFYCSPFCSGVPTGSWVNVSKRYLGLEVKVDGKIHYGWARMNVSVKGSSIVGTLTGYAYETVPGKPIKAGQTKDDDEATVQPASLGHLAQGASALSAWRSK